MTATVPFDDDLLDMASGYERTFLIRAALRLGLAEAIGDTVAGGADLARATGTHEPSLVRLLRALTALGVLTEARPGEFRLTGRGQRLRPDATGSMHGLLTYVVDDATWDAWPALDLAVRTGEQAFEHVHGTDYMTHVGWSEGSPIRDAVDRHLIDDTRAVVAALLATTDLSRFTCVVDVGGGSGPMVAAVLAAHPHLRGTLLDTEDGARLAPEVLAAAGVTGRCEIVAGDFFASVPPADLYLCKSVVFNWPDDADVARLLANCRSAMTGDGRLLLAEQVLPETVDGSVPPSLYLDDVASVVALGGRLRTEPEYRALLTGAGFTTTVHPLPGAPRGYVLLEATPV